uniref:Centrosomal protein 43 n=1 Tax=Eptatretus burgeri TaxID=7764 RepID=A0A8C4N8N1_EPTBU
MSAEEDTELRDLLVQTLETNGVLGKIKAELRAAVFVALEEQERVQNKTPLVNKHLKSFIATKDGQLVTGLVAEFLSHFNLNYTLAVFGPETNMASELEARDELVQRLGLSETEETKNAPLLSLILSQSRKLTSPKHTAQQNVLENDEVTSRKASAGSTRSKIPRCAGTPQTAEGKLRTGSRSREQPADSSPSENGSHDNHSLDSLSLISDAKPSQKALGASADILNSPQRHLQPLQCSRLDKLDDKEEELEDSFFDDIPDKIGASSRISLLANWESSQDHQLHSLLEGEARPAQGTTTSSAQPKAGKEDDYDDDFLSSHPSDKSITEELAADDLSGSDLLDVSLKHPI